ncbi:MAG: hypothetical protein ONB48_00250 [candidate division KSB1 bacterium]|nr:hypothetical protein [candidate division KSB1 bacterium]MDZ7272894.1 hypothetical protein [candidate division KSB1 bacterium]MDZ7284083.1 hypothetical protein [candidate division KSB1 bacterium]MDZ7297519.1 hypothetical protein [candidate division KSB1 bacterium]MDZ7308255.1 hypothetical protein [candidate division KSB1 bacterium]
MKGFCRTPTAVLMLASLLLPACQPEPRPEQPNKSYALAFDPSQSDSAAVRIAREISRAVGSEKLAQVKQLSFHYTVQSDTGIIVDWSHDWDRQTNRYRLAGRLGQDQIVVYFNLNSQQEGAVFTNGRRAGVEEAHSLLGMAYSRFINDTYWLLCPFKLMDPGARLQYEGTQEVQGVRYEVLRLSFIERVGLTPDNVYRLFIDPATYLLRRWEYMPVAGATPVAAVWENWQDFGEFKLATERKMEGSNRRIVFTNIMAAAEVDSTIFEVPSQIGAGQR